MDRNPQRRPTVSAQSTNPSSLRHCSYPSPATSPPTEASSLKSGPKLKHRSAPPKPPALTRVKGTIAMDSLSRMSSGPKLPPQSALPRVNRSTEMSWLNDASPMSGTPRTATPRTPQRSRSGTPEPAPPPLVNPSSALLQDLLNEQRASQGSKGATSEDLKQSAPRTPERSESRSQSRSQSHSPVQSQSQSRSQSQEETGSDKQRKIQIALSAGQKQPHEMGVREMGEYVSKLNKQNFDLKLEIFHRVQQMNTMEKRLQHMEQMEEEISRLRGIEEEFQELRDAEADNQRLRESNEQLRQEIDRRDHAITEAVDMICFLENKVARTQTGVDSRPSTARSYENHSPGATTPKQASVLDIPERTSSKRGTMLSNHRRISSDSRFLKQTPSFLSEATKSTTALRSLYTPASLSEMTKSESLQSMNETTEPESPRLSALSECSELYPPDGPGEDGFDQIEIPVKPDSTDISDETSEGSDATDETKDQSHIDCWIQPPRDIFLGDVPGRDIGSSNLFKQAKFSFDSDNGSSQKTRLDSVFGSTGLPPTPDTMSTAYAGPNRSNGSIIAEKSFADNGLPMNHRLRRPRSAGELTAKWGSDNSAVVGSVDANASDATLRRPSIDEEDESPTFPLNSLTSRDDRIYSQEPVDISRYGYYGGNALLNGEGLERVLSKLDNSHYGTMKRRNSVHEESSSSLSSSPPLTPQDWIEASKPHPGGRAESSDFLQVGNKPANSRLLRSRMPSQSSFLGRRHSIDSNIRDSDIPMIPTLDLRSLEPGPQPESDADRRIIGRKISLRPPFFARSPPPRRLQPSLLPEGVDPDDGAPAPVVHKARNQGLPKTLKKIQNAEDHGPRLGASMAMNAVAQDGDTQRTLPHSYTESGFMNSSVPRPGTPSSKEHKRRSSLGIFGWMKGASGLGKKAEPEAPPAKATVPPPVLAMRRASDFPIKLPDSTRNFAMGAMNIAIEDFASKKPRMEDEEPSRRPRYMDRRSRRG
ncbi:hypothetical protein BO71DRAFT_428073 [Aspergillus ellipticus CBS 707.79]|uniref:Uncharacterized protein n=1 Tax=Aspergillus ellipticus CBS 707.79 TaxID=1448320 RepID=A0A319DHH9_9EURO|nr:hypothetical protein BO71DRAFT_428073 [Aspergillus ellipticus CBS 707.79]